MKVLVFGKNGQLGNQLFKDFGKDKNFIFLSRDQANFINLKQIEEIIYKIKPRVIINAAAYTNVNLAEDESGTANIVNGKALQLISNTSKKLNIFLIHYSTDYVFDGKSKKAYTETDLPNPINAYGYSKLIGEKYIMNSGCNYIIFRVSWVMSSTGNNFIKKIIQLAETKNEIKVINDQIGVPTSTALISNITKKILIKNDFKKKEIFHLVPDGHTDWYSLSKIILDYLETSKTNLKLRKEKIIPIKTSEFESNVKRPLNSVLSNQKLSEFLKIKLGNWEDGVTRILKDLVSL
jgi:dTDP-4-dehydrorhamnose reductase